MLLGPVEVVEHREQHGDDRADRALALDLAVRLGALAVVRILGGDPLQVGEVLVARLPHLGLRRVQDVVDREHVVVVLCGLGCRGIRRTCLGGRAGGIRRLDPLGPGRRTSPVSGSIARRL